ncbi:MAG: hypothetical protein LBD23_01260 [Oscillospiraceae bacterium]|jgi:hypothetical protein|nr:hypothetical protein [Oscillospiraceae bacterium]
MEFQQVLSILSVITSLFIGVAVFMGNRKKDSNSEGREWGAFVGEYQARKDSTDNQDNTTTTTGTNRVTVRATRRDGNSQGTVTTTNTTYEYVRVNNNHTFSYRVRRVIRNFAYRR